jgi:ketosteroid isomerase-like protein
MKSPLIKALMLYAMLLAASCASDNDTPEKKEELKKIIADYYNALTNRDTVALKDLTTDNFVLWDDGVIFTNQTAIKAISGGKSFKATFSFDSLNIHMDKRNASVYYFKNAEFVFNDTIHMPAKFLESATFNKEGNKWKLRFLQSSPRKIPMPMNPGKRTAGT